MSVLVNVDQLAFEIARGHGSTLLACFWGAREGSGRRRFHSHHIPTSMYCDPQLALAGVPGESKGRNPLPDPVKMERWFESWGLDDRSPVIVYDEGHGVYAARAWWTLRWAGVQNVHILDGGQAAWDRAGNPLIGGPGNLAIDKAMQPSAGHMPVLTLDEVKDFDGILLDARGPRRFAGYREILDLKAGHIPGAINIPASAMSNADGTYLSVAEMRQVFTDAGVDPATPGENIVVYSGSGNHSAKLLAAMEMMGITGAAHYVGGWSQWSADVANPVEHGA